MKLIAIVGLTGSGKSEAAKILESEDYQKIRFGDITEEELKKAGMEINETNEKYMRERLRKEHGMAAYAIKSLPKIKSALEQGKEVVIDGLYSWDEYLILKNTFGEELKILAIQASPKTRYERLANRPVRPLTHEEARKRDHAEIENIQKGGPIAIADITIINEGTTDDLKAKIFRYTGIIKRPSWDEYYLSIAKKVASRGTCLRRIFGSVIVNDGQIVSTGYTGAPRGTKNCVDVGECPREKAKIPRGTRYELCRSVHSEQNAIIQAGREKTMGATLYLYGEHVQDRALISGIKPCKFCTREIINAGIKTVVAKSKEGIIKYNVDDWIKEDKFSITEEDLKNY